MRPATARTSGVVFPPIRYLAPPGNGNLQGTRLLLIPCYSSTNAMQNSITGRTQVTIQAASISESFIKAGTLRAIAVAGSKRIDSLAGVPAISETLKSVDLQGWFMLMAPV